MERFLGAITTGCMRPFVPRTNKNEITTLRIIWRHNYWLHAYLEQIKMRYITTTTLRIILARVAPWHYLAQHVFNIAKKCQGVTRMVKIFDNPNPHSTNFVAPTLTAPNPITPLFTLLLNISHRLPCPGPTLWPVEWRRVLLLLLPRPLRREMFNTDGHPLRHRWTSLMFPTHPSVLL